jgi:dTDP-4-dehydrorhamnose reductase
MAAGARGIWHLSNSGIATRYTFAQAVVRAWQQPTVIRPCSTSDEQAFAPRGSQMPRLSVLDCSVTYLRLGLELRFWESALAEYSRSARMPKV